MSTQRRIVFQIGELPPILETGMQDHFESYRLDTHPDRDGLLASRGKHCAAVIARGSNGVNAALMERLPRLKIIANFGVGYERVDLAAATSRGIVVTNTPDVLTDCVADMAVGLLIDVARQISASDRFIRAKRWPGSHVYPLTRSVHHKRVGIVGFGRIGQAIGRRLHGFGTELRYHNRRPVAGHERTYEPSICALAQWADYLIVAVVGGRETVGLIDKMVLDALGADGYLINIARGSVVDEAALIEALARKTIAGAALDVFREEPQVPETLLTMENVVLTPHIGSATQETREAMGMLALRNVLHFFETGEALTPVAAQS